MKHKRVFLITDQSLSSLIKTLQQETQGPVKHDLVKPPVYFKVSMK